MKEYHVESGRCIADAAHGLAALAHQESAMARMEFNGIVLYAGPGTSADMVIDAYSDQVELRQVKRNRPPRHKLAGQSIGKIIDALEGATEEERRRVIEAVDAYFDWERPEPEEEVDGPSSRNISVNVQGLKSETLSMFPGDDEEMLLAKLVTAFAQAMWNKLLAKKRDGWKGWNDHGGPAIQARLTYRVNDQMRTWQNDPDDTDSIIDAANYLAFIWNLRGRKGGKP